MAKRTDEEVKQIIDRLRRYCPEGSEVTTYISHTTKTGTKTVLVLAAVSVEEYNAGRPSVCDISGLVATVADRPFDRRRGGVVMKGDGYDAGAEVVCKLAQVLHGHEDGLEWRRL